MKMNDVREQRDSANKYKLESKLIGKTRNGNFSSAKKKRNRHMYTKKMLICQNLPYYKQTKIIILQNMGWPR